MKVVLVVICISILPKALKCEERKVINARIDSGPKTKGVILYNVGKFRKYNNDNESNLSPKKQYVTDLHTSFGASPAERTPRVKKVLSFYNESSVRAKRSIVNKAERHGHHEVQSKKEEQVKLSNAKQKKALRQKQSKRTARAARLHARLARKGNKKAASSKSKSHQKRAKKKRVKRTGTKSLAAKQKKNIIVRNVKKIKKVVARSVGKEAKKDNHKQRNGRRLTAAHDALIEDYPYVVSIQKKGVHWCAGALINQRIVITTANCLWRSNRVSRMTVRAGSRYPERGGQVARIAEVKTHPKWSIRSLPDNDVGLVLLDKDIRFSDNVHSVDLPGKHMMPAYGDAWVTSFGTNRRDGLVTEPARSLHVYHASVLPAPQCNNVTMRYGVAVSDNFLCIAQAGHRGPCTRDTGAPAVSDGIIWGVASWGIRKLCGTERFPAMFSYLGAPSNVDFISDALLDFMSEERHNPFPDKVVGTTDAITTASPPSHTTDETDRSTLSS